MFIKMQEFNVILLKQKHGNIWKYFDEYQNLSRREKCTDQIDTCEDAQRIHIPEKSPRDWLATCSKTSQVI